MTPVAMPAGTRDAQYRPDISIRIAQRLEEWIDQKGMPGDFDQIEEAIANGWLNVLFPVMSRDSEDFIRRDVLGV